MALPRQAETLQPLAHEGAQSKGLVRCQRVTGHYRLQQAHQRAHGHWLKSLLRSSTKDSTQPKQQGQRHSADAPGFLHSLGKPKNTKATPERGSLAAKAECSSIEGQLWLLGCYLPTEQQRVTAKSSSCLQLPYLTDRGEQHSP